MALKKSVKEKLWAAVIGVHMLSLAVVLVFRTFMV